ncbi:alpha/beta fold hydrolase [Chitinophaga sp. GbtcB8]|uniref:alpha/beta fold hydrolase n=1 Tax=Chitinophaga sp. GbtcB8 TaxID=2824753 RepID=UPI001C3081F4|nr:alpha/beta hydrolase [Chitinophaga sp. GbtcB8]
MKHEKDPNKPTIVLLHDSLGCIELWRDFPKNLGALADCNVLAYDRLGYGKSGPFITLKRDNNYLEIEADILPEVQSY